MKWTNFNDLDPPSDKELLVFYENGPLDRGCIIAVKNSDGGWKLPEAKTYIMIKWAELGLPEVPKRELHRCDSPFGHFSCIEQMGSLMITNFIKADDSRSVYWPVKICPFCGYSIKDKVTSNAEWGANWPSTRPVYDKKEKE